jgi:6-phosphogluconolactonase
MKVNQEPMTIELQKFSDRATMTAALADQLVDKLRQSVAARGSASLIVSGGTTPKALFEILAGRELPWQKVTVSLADERWIDPASPDSNEHLVRTSLLVDKAAAAQFVPLKARRGSPRQSESACEKALKKIPSPFDVVLLGMGDDGHTASLFPHAEGLDEALDMNSGRHCKAMTPKELPAHAPYPRMTLTLPRLLDSRWIVLLITGETKLGVYGQALAVHDVAAMPVSAVLRQERTPVSVFWAP